MTISSQRLDLNVPFTQKDQAKACGAKWDGAKRCWYAPAGVDSQLFARWLSSSSSLIEPLSVDSPPSEADSKNLITIETGIRLSTFLAKAAEAIAQKLPAAQWIQCEISELNRRQDGTIFLDLVEYDQNRLMIAKTRACLWQIKAQAVSQKFLEATGSELQTQLKVLLLCRASFHAKSGFSLFIEDIDPIYTLGDMAAKLAKIRQQLIQEQIFEANQRLTLPSDFLRIAVIAPEQAAGLEDFKREADKLTQHRLCEFYYYTAIFQGEKAAASLVDALQQSYQAQQKFDALVIIRGGGAAADLAWLNDEAIARAISRSPLPIISGIGHERDRTIIDEMAKLCLGTPSKVIQYISQGILQQGQQAIQNVQFIQQQSLAIINNKYLQLQHLYQLLSHGSQLMPPKMDNILEQYRHMATLQAKANLNQALSNSHYGLTQVKQNSHVVLQKAQQSFLALRQQTGLQTYALCQQRQMALAHLQTDITTFIPKILAHTHERAVQRYQTTVDLAQRFLRQAHQQITQPWQIMVNQSKKSLLLNQHALSDEIQRIRALINQQQQFADQAIKQSLQWISVKTNNHSDLMQTLLQNLISLILGFSPSATLQRGYAIILDKHDKIITTQVAAKLAKQLRIQFQDGILGVMHDPIVQ